MNLEVTFRHYSRVIFSFTSSVFSISRLIGSVTNSVDIEERQFEDHHQSKPVTVVRHISWSAFKHYVKDWSDGYMKEECLAMAKPHNIISTYMFTQESKEWSPSLKRDADHDLGSVESNI